MGRLTPILVRTAAGGAATLALASGGCGDRPQPPTRLVDGTNPTTLPVRLEGLDRNGIGSRLTITSVRRLGAFGRNCVDSFRPEFRVAANATVIRRTGVLGESLTFENIDHDVVLGCDRGDGGTAASGRWCGRAAGRLFAGRLRDLRLDIACRTHRGAQIGFGWIQADAGTHWIGARVGDVTEVSEVAAGLPVRVATTDVDPGNASATFAIVEYAESGRALRSYRVSVGVAG